MKKYLIMIGAAILVMALASPSMAQFKSWGHLEFQTIWIKNQDFNIPTDKDETRKHIAERFRYYLQYGDPKTVRAVIGFEADGTDWGMERNTTNTVAGGAMSTYGTDNVQLEIKHAYLDFNIPNTPVGLSIGLQGYIIGGRLFQSKDAPGIIADVNFAPHKIAAFWWRENDESRTTYHVNDTYGLTWDMKKKEFDVGALFAYKNDLYTGYQSTVTDQYADHPWWIGVWGGFRPGNWDFSASFYYVGGKQDYETATDKDYKAWAGEAEATYRIGPGMFAGIGFFYSTGNDADKNDQINRYSLPTASEVVSGFGNDLSVFYYRNSGQMGYYHQKQLDYTGTWYGNVNFQYSPLAWLRMRLNYMYIGDTSKGTAGLSGINSPIGARTDKDEDFIGHEINLITNISIYKGFVYNIGLGYFMPGEVYDTASKSADSAYAILSKMVYSF